MPEHTAGLRKKSNKNTLAFRLLNTIANKKKINIIKNTLSLSNFSNLIKDISAGLPRRNANHKVPNLIVFQNNIVPSNINLKLTLIINQIKKLLPIIFSNKFIVGLQDLYPFKSMYPNLHKVNSKIIIIQRNCVAGLQ